MCYNKSGVRTTAKHIQPFFWDADLSKIDIEENKQYIIERILELGDQEAVRWIFSIFSLKEIKKTLEGSRRISQKSKNFWFIFLEDHPNV